MGTGQGVSVLHLIKTFEKVTGSAVPYKIVERREGDISTMFANADLAETELGWKAKHTLEEMCKFFYLVVALLRQMFKIFVLLSLQVPIFGDGKQ